MNKFEEYLNSYMENIEKGIKVLFLVLLSPLLLVGLPFWYLGKVFGKYL